MPNVREYLLKRRNRKDSGYQNKILKYRLQIFYRVALMIVLTASICGLIYVQIKNRVYTGYKVVSSAERSEAAQAVSISYHGNILTYSKDGASCTGIKGNAIWNQTFEMQNPIIDICGDVVAIGDYNGHTIYVMNASGPIGEIETGMPIRSLCVSAKGLVAAILNDSDTTWIYLLSSSGDRIASFKTTMSASGYPIDVSISGSGELVIVSYLYGDRGMFTSRIAFYNFGEVGQNKSDKLVSGYDYADVIVPLTGFMNDSTAFALADNRLVIYKGRQIPVSQLDYFLTEEVQSVFYNENYIGLVYLNTRGDTKYKIDIFNESGKLVHTQNFDQEFKEIIFQKGQFVIYNETSCTIYTLSGKVKYQGEFAEDIQLLIPANKASRFTLVTTDKIETIDLQ